MKPLQHHTIDPAAARYQWHELDRLLRSKPALGERADILPFFSARRDLAMIISYYYPLIENPDVIAHEYSLGGEFYPDLIVGDSKAQQYLLVEFEDASSTSIFTGRKTKRDWAKRFEGAFSQLIDWLWRLEDMRSTGDFAQAFLGRDASFHGLIVIGKDVNHSVSEQSRLRWRTERTLVDSKKIEVRTFDQLLKDADFRLKYHLGV